MPEQCSPGSTVGRRETVHNQVVMVRSGTIECDSLSLQNGGTSSSSHRVTDDLQHLEYLLSDPFFLQSYWDLYSNKWLLPTNKIPKCERDFEIAYQRWRRKTARVYDAKKWAEASKSWIEPFLKERDFGDAILQRRRRLMGIQPVARPRLEGEPQETLPDYNDACGSPVGKREEEINTLMEAYWESNRLISSVRIEIDMVAYTVGSWIGLSVLTLVDAADGLVGAVRSHY
ncbi:hypothetical protein BDV26DRAFT_296409 [Aspergillus bertholletiae]|uniref:Uncharacterized protein n=1 Tax=Aspergillus bertholletiae TaxID=1226010 RepID=A0A5N7AW88_9EURO|nr:hypothetical protein BDV26DRAFT_296409 [Aspergillus bertholletiae]